jgi:hypothetical protein
MLDPGPLAGCPACSSGAAIDPPFISDAVRWYRLDGRTPVRITSRAEQDAEWDRRERSIRTGEDCYRVARTELPGGREVSTVFLGLDHQWMPDGPPLLFETMVFPECDVCERCSTWDEAVEQHEQVVRDARAR